MKKTIVFGILGLVLCSIFVFAESPTLTVQQEMKEILNLILEKLGIIADKDTIVYVEPNITVEAPQVSIYSDVNVTLPDKECEWVELNQVIPVGSGSSKERSSDGGFVVPNGIEYLDVIFNRIAVSAIGGALGCTFKINDVSCVSVSPSSDYYYYSITDPNCLSALTTGINHYSCPSSNMDRFVKEIYVEMEVKPANC